MNKQRELIEETVEEDEIIRLSDEDDDEIIRLLDEIYEEEQQEEEWQEYVREKALREGYDREMYNMMDYDMNREHRRKLDLYLERSYEKINL